jgi:hypothetical protein
VDDLVRSTVAFGDAITGTDPEAPNGSGAT